MTRDLTARSRGPAGPTTLSGLAHSGDISVVAPRSRLGMIVGVSAVIVGSTIGSALALRGEPESARVPAAAAAASQPRAPSGAASSHSASGPAASANPPIAAPSVAGNPAIAANPTAGANPAAGPNPAVAASPAAALPSPEARAALVAQIQDALRRFVAWSHAHPGARCPDAAALGAGPDPWGQPLRIVCSDQPPDQIAGVLSYGPDGEPGTHDDVVSWTLGPDVTELARGPRWSASRGIATGAATGTGSRRGGARSGGPRAVPPAAVPPATAATPQPPRPPASAGAGSDDSDGDGIPDRR
ncbi:MAG TPA: hypothetical protein VHW23_21190 [Kofleriaceae bacterium]|nr:hypothetical protein [Kofleriaceae bacterium]